MADTELFVFAHLQDGFVPAGRLQLTENNREVQASLFQYGTRYLLRRGAFEVDPVSLPLAQAKDEKGYAFFPVNELPQFGGIRDAAPDAWGRRVIEACRKVPANSLPESVYLLEAGSERVGALDVRRSRDDGPSRGVGSVHSLQYLLEAVERIEHGEPVPGRLTDLLGSGPGAGGARPKASVRDDQGLLWLAKFPSVSDTFDNARAEWATLELARRCGLTVPAIRVEMLGNRPCLLIRRFDRYWVPQGNALEVGAVPFETLPGDDRVEQRLPFVSALTLVGCDEMESRNKGYVDIAAAVRGYLAPSVIRDNKRELFARMVFNILVSNDDDHLRSHGFLRDPRQSCLALSLSARGVGLETAAGAAFWCVLITSTSFRQTRRPHCAHGANTARLPPPAGCASACRRRSVRSRLEPTRTPPSTRPCPPRRTLP